MAGPLVGVDTLVAVINLDVQRALRMGPNVILEFIRPDNTQPDNWAIIKTVTRGFNRPILANDARGDGKLVRFDVVDVDGDLAEVLRTEHLSIRCQGNVYPVGRVEEPQPEEGQMYLINCSTRTLRTTYFDNAR